MYTIAAWKKIAFFYRIGLTSIWSIDVHAFTSRLQILEATSHKTATVQPPTTHLGDHPN